jgi:hypothetical protein
MVGIRLCAAFAALLAGASAAGCSIVEASPPAAPPLLPPLPSRVEAHKSTAELVAAALPAVVLLIQEHPAKPGAPASTTFGAGFLTRDGLVVTSLHVIDGEGKLSAMLYKPGRQSYTPMDGGLMRFLFENQADLVPAERVAADTVTDLAVVRVQADTSHLPKLVWSSEDARPGDHVLALGHPQETVWSFSEGVVGALQYGIVQHTAIVGPGSSVGPLLNEKGEVVGVNVARVANQPSGLSFARPMAIVARTFGDKKVASPLDQSTPAAAALSCWRSQELALSDTADCFDWDHEWEQYRSMAEEARRLAASADVRKRIDECPLGPQAKNAWIAAARERSIHVLDPGYAKNRPADEPGPASPSSAFLADYLDPKKLAERLRNGLRVEETHPVGDSLAWVKLASRGADGSVAQFTELYARVGARWVQRMAPTEDEIAALPAGWPAPVFTLAGKRPHVIASILREASQARCPFGPSSTEAAAAQGGGGRAVLRPTFSIEPQ